MRTLATTTAVLALVATVTFAGPAPVAASSDDDPFFLNWPAYLPASPVGDHVATTGQECVTGEVECVDGVIQEMTERYDALGCDHDATFAFTYLRTTEEYRRAVEDPHFFTDNAFVNHQDAVFARFYFDQFDDWHAGRVEQVSPAWRIAFHAAEEQDVSGMGNVFLGMNAHVNRDLPFVLAEIGLVKPDGTSRKPDHDRVNDFLARTNQYLLADAAKVLDPTLDDADLPGISVDNSVAVQALVAWREQAWRNAERLVAAPTPEARAQVAQQIEQGAALEALVIRAAFAYTPLHDLLGMGPRARNRFCEAKLPTR